MWIDGCLSNFEYLMKVNLISGRTYHDANMNYVFPWINDLKSLDNKVKFLYQRDLSLPVGALDEDRLSFFKSRLETFDDDVCDLGNFLYGSHYSGLGNNSHIRINILFFGQNLTLLKFVQRFVIWKI